MRKNKEKGFTLIELLLAAVIISVIAVVLSKMIFQGYKVFLRANDINQADWQAWLAVQRISQDMHRIDSTEAITTIQPSQLAFTDVGGTAVTYQLSNKNLLRNGAVLANGIQALTFGYLDKNGVATTTVGSVRYVTINITAASNEVNVSLATMSGIRE